MDYHATAIDQLDIVRDYKEDLPEDLQRHFERACDNLGRSIVRAKVSSE